MITLDRPGPDTRAPEDSDGGRVLGRCGAFVFLSTAGVAGVLAEIGFILRSGTLERAVLALPELALPEVVLPEDAAGDWLRDVEERDVPVERRGGPRIGDGDLRDMLARAETSPALWAAKRAADWLR